MADERAEVIVLGAGIVGTALAFHLTERHVGPVVVFDPRTPGAGATGRAAGIVSEQLWDRWDVEVVRESKEEYARLSRRWDPSAYRTIGFARWTSDPEIAAALRSSTERLRSWGVGVGPISSDALFRRVPVARCDDILEAAWHPDDAVVTPSAMTELYAEAARRAGVQFLLGAPLGSFTADGDSWKLSTAGRTVRARRAVVAAGAWSKRLLASVGRPLPLVPYRTQAALLRPPSPSDVLLPSVHDLDLDVYARPEDEGRVLAGDGTEKVEADPETFVPSGDASFVAHLAESFDRRFPGWKDADLVRAWAGVCTATPDRRPLIGPVPGASGLYCITGFNGFGVMRAGGAARRLTEAIASGGAESAFGGLSTVLPGRFGADPPEFLPQPGFTLEAGARPRF
ncbi:MAG TPA: FAD-binding oxidoreductase [Thermoplasmata archaeon]|nr:FAD-binding oxidoreductase [Thermoplasmata archaeon]